MSSNAATSRGGGGSKRGGRSGGSRNQRGKEESALHAATLSEHTEEKYEERKVAVAPASAAVEPGPRVDLSAFTTSDGFIDAVSQVVSAAKLHSASSPGAKPIAMSDMITAVMTAWETTEAPPPTAAASATPETSPAPPRATSGGEGDHDKEATTTSAAAATDTSANSRNSNRKSKNERPSRGASKRNEEEEQNREAGGDSPKKKKGPVEEEEAPKQEMVAVTEADGAAVRVSNKNRRNNKGKKDGSENGAPSTSSDVVAKDEDVSSKTKSVKAVLTVPEKKDDGGKKQQGTPAPKVADSVAVLPPPGMTGIAAGAVVVQNNDDEDNEDEEVVYKSPIKQHPAKVQQKPTGTRTPPPSQEAAKDGSSVAPSSSFPGVPPQQAVTRKDHHTIPPSAAGSAPQSTGVMGCPEQGNNNPPAPNNAATPATICKYVNNKNGCQRGASCKFSHIENPSNSRLVRAPPTVASPDVQVPFPKSVQQEVQAAALSSTKPAALSEEGGWSTPFQGGDFGINSQQSTPTTMVTTQQGSALPAPPQPTKMAAVHSQHVNPSSLPVVNPSAAPLVAPQQQHRAEQRTPGGTPQRPQQQQQQPTATGAPQVPAPRNTQNTQREEQSHGPWDNVEPVSAGSCNDMPSETLIHYEQVDPAMYSPDPVFDVQVFDQLTSAGQAGNMASADQADRMLRMYSVTSNPNSLPLESLPGFLQYWAKALENDSPSEMTFAVEILTKFTCRTGFSSLSFETKFGMRALFLLSRVAGEMMRNLRHFDHSIQLRILWIVGNLVLLPYPPREDGGSSEQPSLYKTSALLIECEAVENCLYAFIMAPPENSQGPENQLRKNLKTQALWTLSNILFRHPDLRSSARQCTIDMHYGSSPMWKPMAEAWKAILFNTDTKVVHTPGFATLEAISTNVGNHLQCNLFDTLTCTVGATDLTQSIREKAVLCLSLMLGNGWQSPITPQVSRPSHVANCDSYILTILSFSLTEQQQWNPETGKKEERTLDLDTCYYALAGIWRLIQVTGVTSLPSPQSEEQQSRNDKKVADAEFVSQEATNILLLNLPTILKALSTAEDLTGGARLRWGKNTAVPPEKRKHDILMTVFNILLPVLNTQHASSRGHASTATGANRVSPFMTPSPPPSGALLAPGSQSISPLPPAAPFTAPKQKAGGSPGGGPTLDQKEEDSLFLLVAKVLKAKVAAVPFPPMTPQTSGSNLDMGAGGVPSPAAIAAAAASASVGVASATCCLEDSSFFLFHQLSTQHCLSEACQYLRDALVVGSSATPGQLEILQQEEVIDSLVVCAGGFAPGQQNIAQQDGEEGSGSFPASAQQELGDSPRKEALWALLNLCTGRQALAGNYRLLSSLVHCGVPKCLSEALVAAVSQVQFLFHNCDTSRNSRRVPHELAKSLSVILEAFEVLRKAIANVPQLSATIECFFGCYESDLKAEHLGCQHSSTYSCFDTLKNAVEFLGGLDEDVLQEMDLSTQVMEEALSIHQWLPEKPRCRDPATILAAPRAEVNSAPRHHKETAVASSTTPAEDTRPARNNSGRKKQPRKAKDEEAEAGSSPKPTTAERKPKERESRKKVEEKKVVEEEAVAVAAPLPTTETSRPNNRNKGRGDARNKQDDKKQEEAVESKKESASTAEPPVVKSKPKSEAPWAKSQSDAPVPTTESSVKKSDNRKKGPENTNNNKQNDKKGEEEKKAEKTSRKEDAVEYSMNTKEVTPVKKSNNVPPKAQGPWGKPLSDAVKASASTAPPPAAVEEKKTESTSSSKRKGGRGGQ